MIVLSEDGGKNLVNIDCWADIAERPAFAGELPLEGLVLKDVIAKYNLQESPPCGLSNCRTKHQKGFLFVTKGGFEINIGHVCGKKHFGLEYKALTDVFTVALNSQRYRESLNKLQNRKGWYSDQIANLNTAAGEPACYKNVSRLLSTGFPDKIIASLKERSKRSNHIVYQNIELSEKEKEIAVETGDSTFIRQEELFRIQGLNAVLGHIKLRKILEIDLGAEFDAFFNVVPDQLNYQDLKHWDRWAKKLDNSIREASHLIDACKQFVHHDNTQSIRNHSNLL